MPDMVTKLTSFWKVVVENEGRGESPSIPPHRLHFSCLPSLSPVPFSLPLSDTLLFWVSAAAFLEPGWGSGPRVEGRGVFPVRFPEPPPSGLGRDVLFQQSLGGWLTSAGSYLGACLSENTQLPETPGAPPQLRAGRGWSAPRPRTAQREVTGHKSKETREIAWREAVRGVLESDMT